LPVTAARPLLRQRLLAERAAFAGRPDAAVARASLARHLQELVLTLEPSCLGVYWPVRSEFNAPAALASHAGCAGLPLALPFVRKQPAQMHYRAWDGRAPALLDEARIPSSDGPEVVPDVVLAPCVGYTRAGVRLGYGGGYFDRWIAAHPQATTIGIAWAFSELRAAEFAAQPHDQLLTLVLTEHGVVGPAG
jgi:5,10-methenyltetrahydrofolate synthetase